MIAVLRLGHRIDRDKRATTHVALVARAFGAHKISVEHEDKKLGSNIRSVCKRFGGDFQIETGVNSKRILRNRKGIIVHLTMYGARLNKVVDEITVSKDCLIVVGGEKVPGFVYELSDFNVAVGNQPHSEIAALAIFLDRFTGGRWQDKKFDGEVEIIPSNKGKKVVSKK